MNPVLAILLAWGLFSSTHLVMASDPIRARLVARLGERGFVNVFSAVAAVAFTILSVTGAVFHAQGPPGLALAGHALARPVAIGAIFLGFALIAGSLTGYARSPMALFSNRVAEPRGVEAISRHGFFYGLACWALAHVLLVPTLASAVFFGGFAFQAVLGSALQDRKLAARLGAPYENYLAKTSAVPFAAIVRGRARFVLSDQPWLAYGVGLAIAWLLREAHAHVFDYYGLYLVAVTLGGAALATWSAERRTRRLPQELSRG